LCIVEAMNALVSAVRAPLSPAVIFGGLQLVLGLSWAVYALFLPQLVVAAGLPRAIVPWVLVLDQLVFALSDPWAGAASDRAAAQARRIGAPVAWLSGGAGLAFLLLPFTAHTGSSAFMGVLLLVWAVSTAALRAPLAALLGRHLPGSDAPNAALITAGLALSGVAGGLLIPVLRDASPYLAFACAGAGTALVAWLAVPAERRLLAATGAAARTSPAAAADAAGSDTGSSANQDPGAGLVGVRVGPSGSGAVALFGAAALLAAGLQLHAFIAGPAGLAASGVPAGATVFWIGSALACGLFTALRRHADMRRLGVFAVVLGVLALGGFGALDSPAPKAVAHLLAGGAWGLGMAAVISRVFAFGRAGARVGLAAGCLFALLAVATLIRIALVALGLWSAIGPGAALWAAAVCWTLAAVLLALPSPQERAS